jgi:uncharacterized membrane protein YgaE (UPF0421/DUF939 family)
MREHLRNVTIAIQYLFVSLLAYLGAYFITGSMADTPLLTTTGALWSMVSGIVVMQETRQGTIDNAWLRILGSLIGAVMSAIYLSFLPFNPFGMAVTIGLTVLICQELHVPGHPRLAALTVGVIMVISLINPGMNPVVNAGLRFSESVIGSGAAILLIAIWPYLVKSPLE